MKLGMNLSHWDMGTTALPNPNLLVYGTGWSLPGVAGAPVYRPTGPLPPPGYQAGTATWGYVRPGTYTITCPSTGTSVIRFNCLDVPGGTVDLTFTAAGESYSYALKSVGPGFMVMQNEGAHDLCLLAPGGAIGETWHPDYLSMLRPYKPCLRGMDTLLTNFVPSAMGPYPWIAPPTREHQGLAGLVELGNALGADLWINIPFTWASSAGASPHCYALGAYLNEHYCVPGGTIYLERGNESWNPGISGDYNYILGTDGHGTGGQLGSILDPSTGKTLQSEGAWWSAGYVWLANCAFEAVTALITNVATKRVYAGAAANWGLFGYPFAGRLQQWGYKADVFSVAPYASLPGTGPYTTAALQALVNAGNMAGAIDLFVQGIQSVFPELQAWLGPFQQSCQAAGVEGWYYEMGGIDTGGGIWQPPNNLGSLAQALIQSPQMGALTTQYLGVVAPFAAGGNWYDDCGNTSPTMWGAQANIDTPSQISEALVAYAAASN